MKVVNGFVVELVGTRKRPVAVAHCAHCGALVVAEGNGDLELVTWLAENGRCPHCTLAGA